MEHERTAMMDYSNSKPVHFIDTCDRRPFRKDTTFVLVSFFPFSKRFFFTFAKTIDLKHENLKFMDTSDTLFLFRLIVKIESEFTYQKLFLLHHNIVKQESPYSKSGKPN